MTKLYAVCTDQDPDMVFTYEAESAQEAAELYLDDPDAIGDVVRVWELDRYPPAFVKVKARGEVLLLAGSPKVET